MWYFITPEEYEFVKCRIEKLVDAAPGSEEAKELKVLARLVMEFERGGGAASS